MLYCGSGKKGLNALRTLPILKRYIGILTHDHETALYHFGTGHGKCNVHLGRYLCKNMEETTNIWCHDMEMSLRGLDHARNERKRRGITAFSGKQLERFSLRYGELVAQGYEANKKTNGRLAKKKEMTLLLKARKLKRKPRPNIPISLAANLA